MAKELEGAKVAAAEGRKNAALLAQKLQESDKKEALLKTALSELSGTTTK